MDWRRGRNLIDVLIGGAHHNALHQPPLGCKTLGGMEPGGDTRLSLPAHCAQLPAPATRARVISCFMSPTLFRYQIFDANEDLHIYTFLRGQGWKVQIPKQTMENPASGRGIACPHCEYCNRRESSCY